LNFKGEKKKQNGNEEKEWNKVGNETKFGMISIPLRHALLGVNL